VCGLQDQPQALVVQPGAVSEVEVSESEAVSQFPGVMRLLTSPPGLLKDWADLSERLERLDLCLPWPPSSSDSWLDWRLCREEEAVQQKERSE
jgi:hypothetical protein